MFSNVFTLRAATRVAGLALFGTLAYISSRSWEDSPAPPPNPEHFFDTPCSPEDIEAEIENPLDQQNCVPNPNLNPEETTTRPSTAPIDFCDICGKPTELACSVCKSAFYCGPQHNKEVRSRRGSKLLP